MKKSILIIFSVFLIILAIAGYFYLTYFYNDEEFEVITLVPENAIAVYESNNVISSWNIIQEKELWASLNNLPIFSQVNTSLLVLDSITGRKGNLDKLFRSNPICISFHQTSKESLGSVFYFKIKDLESYDIIIKAISDIKKKDYIKTDKRTYLGEEIHELRDSRSKQLFSYTIYKDHFIGSYAPVLLEDVIRNIEEDESISFKEKNYKLFSIVGTTGDDEKLYFNLGKLKSLLSVFSSNSEINDFLAHFGDGIKVNFTFHDQEFLLNGYTLTGNTSAEYFLSTLKAQEAGSFKMGNFIPNRTAGLYHVTFHDGKLWYQNLYSFWKKKIPHQAKEHNELKLNYDVDPQRLFNWMGGEIALASLQSMEVKNPDKLVVIKANDVPEAYNQMNKLASQADQISGDSLFKENFSDIDIRQLNIKEFPSKLLGSNFSGFPTSYFSAIGQYIIIGNSLQVMKNTIADIQADNVWGKSVVMNQYFEKTLGAANISYIINTQRSWNSIIHHLNNNWKTYFTSNSEALKNFNMVALQFSESGNEFYTGLHVQHQNSSLKEDKSPEFNVLAGVDVAAPIISKPIYVNRLGEKNSEILFQDSLFYLYKISDEGKVLWKDSIGDKIIGEIHQIDYLKNGNLQYAFTTSNAFHIISDGGSYINNNFPHSLDFPVHYFKVVDYGNSKNYRFLFASEKGDLYMFDKQLSVLDGWNPKNFKSKASTAPFHLRVRGKDYIISLQENGELNIMNRRGEMLPGFPLNLLNNYNNDIFVDVGNSPSQTILTTISEKGELIKVNLEGKIIKKEQLYRPSRETRFVLCIDEYKYNYVIARQELGILTLLDAKGEVILEKDYITSGALEIQYFNAGIEKEIFAVTDKIQEFTYLYDKNGLLINSRPIDSSHKIALQYFEALGKYDVAATYNTLIYQVNFTR